MSKDLHLSVANPCAESWDHMSPKPQGRFCTSCSKTVINFSTMTDLEILDWLAHHAGPVCGRFHPDQINRPLTGQPSKKSGPGRYWNYFIALLLSSSELAAQTQPSKPPTTQQIPFGREGRYLLGDTVMEPEPTSPPAILRGRMVDDNRQPVPFATILYEENKGVAADADGCFSIPVANLAGVRTLSISAAGYVTLKVDVQKLNLDGSMHMQTLPTMQMQPTTMGDVLITRVRHHKKKLIADTLSIIKDTVTSCLGLPKNNFIIYPNPVARGNSITITAQRDKSENYAVQLFDLTGGLLQSITAGRDQLSGAFRLTLPPTLSPGTYIVRLSHPGTNKVFTRQIVVL